MGDFSLLVRLKYDALDSQQKQIFDEEYKRRKKPFDEHYNSNIALEVLKDISIMFPAIETKSVDNIVPKKSVNNHYIVQKKRSGKNYSFYIIVGIIALFSVSAFFLKPDRAKMQNAIIDKILLQKPQIFKTMKNFFLGEKISEEYAQNLVANTLSKNGYSNLGIYEEDFVLLRKLDYRNEDSKENIISAYGFLGFTKVFFNNEDLRENNSFNKNPNENRKDQNKGVDIVRAESYKPSKEYNYYDEQSKIRHKKEIIENTEAENISNQGDSIQIN